MIYFIQEGEDGPVKIGHTYEGLNDRLSQLQTGNSNTLKVIGSINGDRIDERELHFKFKKLHIRGEWFQYRQELIEFLKNTPSEKYYIPKPGLGINKSTIVISIPVEPQNNITDHSSLIFENQRLRLIIRRLSVLTKSWRGRGIERALRKLCMSHEREIIRLKSNLKGL